MQKLENILFLDIETVPRTQGFDELEERWKSLWERKSQALFRDERSAEEAYERAGIYAEFGKVICISVGYLVRSKGKLVLRVKSFANEDETRILNDFSQLLKTRFNSDRHYLCAHNGKEFDFPYLCRRMVINSIKLPRILDLAGKKPWDVRHIDTMQLWKFGDFKSYTSLDLLAAAFNIPSPKSDLDGSKVAHTYYRENDLAKIVLYCQKDVSTLASIYLRMNNLPALTAEQIVEV